MVLASQVSVNTSENGVLSGLTGGSGQGDTRLTLVRRVLASTTFEHSPKLRAFLEYVCRCAIENQPAAATEQQIGIHVFGRPPGYNANEDNIVRSQARLLRLKLEHHFSNEGRHEPVVITIPKGRYLPAFEPRFEEREVKAAVEPEVAVDAKSDQKPPLVGGDDQHKSRQKWLPLFVVAAIVAAVVIAWIVRTSLRSRQSESDTAAQKEAATVPSAPAPLITSANFTAIRFAAGYTGVPFLDVAGHQWEPDKFYQGGISKPGPQELFPPVSDPSLFRTIREGVPLAAHASSGFRYDLAVPPGAYELRLYFADPVRHAVPGHDGQHMRHFQVNLNGSPILTNFDAVADAGAGAVAIRAFKDVSPASDGKVHLEFVPAPDLPFLSALELTPGIPGKLQPIRMTAHSVDLVDSDGTHWGADKYFMYGSTITYASPENVSKILPIYSVERFGNFSYAIPVPPGSYTLRLHFMETFFGPSALSGLCWGAGCRIFDVTCNGEMLLKDFDIYQTAGGDAHPVIRTFHGLHPNGQGKLLISFSPKMDYGEIRAVEVIDDASEGARKLR
jgi:hypothetical protein